MDRVKLELLLSELRAKRSRAAKSKYASPRLAVEALAAFDRKIERYAAELKRLVE